VSEEGFLFFFFFFHKEREASKSGTVLFHEGMQEFKVWNYEESVKLFERAAAKGHQEAKWIVSVVKGVAPEKSALKEAFAKTETPLGWFFAGLWSVGDSRERFDFYKKSAEGGGSWGQANYGYYFRDGGQFVEKDREVFVEWLEKAANQHNPRAMNVLGEWFREEEEYEKALSYFRAAADLGWKDSMNSLGEMLENGEGCAKDLRQAAIWYAKGGHNYFFKVLSGARNVFEDDETDELGCDFDQLCSSLGWGLFWHMYGTNAWDWRSDENKAFGNHCLDYYCEIVELQQKSIFTFLLCWKEMVGVKDVGLMIGQMIWEGREDNLMKPLAKNDGRAAFWSELLCRK
jgi:tetratricopeptide (TPR) repeat protein